jgi:predicted CoA-substrate-specific enzyme activase
MTDAVRLGVDIGALFVKAVAVNAAGEVTDAVYRAHQSDPAPIVREFLARHPQRGAVGATGSRAAVAAQTPGVAVVHVVRALTAAASRRFPDAANILDIGGRSCTLIHLDRNGRFLGFTTNSLCAAGTGSFLDEQARRLDLDYATIGDFAFDRAPPSIASRCAVFAKSDLIHRQQEGHAKAALWAGLCKGCVDTMLQTLLRGRPLDGPTLVVGGVAQNAQVVEWLKQRHDPILTWEHGHLAAAFGAAMLADGGLSTADRGIEAAAALTAGPPAANRDDRAAPLRLVRSRYPSFAVAHEYEDAAGTEVRIHQPAGPRDGRCFLGIDIGSTSTKLVLIEPGGEVLLDVYRKTGGDPLGAVRRLFAAVQTLAAERGWTLDVQGCGATGSGRRFAGKIVGADCIVNEITAHVAGARSVDPSVETIFEIGGQDSKFMSLRDGAIREANMNYVCAAGTGSFVEEQANKLGYKVAEIGDVVLGLAPPHSSDRCTVFMEEDVTQLLGHGFTRDEAIASVMYSVAKNYLAKVVGCRRVSKDRIFFQGATARNKGLVAAFEQLLGVEVVVSPLCHQMGAYGVALLAARRRAGQGPSAFRGFDLAERRVELSFDTCGYCHNRCQITYANVEHSPDRPSWGYQCGREPAATQARVSRDFALFRQRDRLLADVLAQQTAPAGAPRIGLGMSLSAFSFLPFWTALLNRLGFRVAVTGPTDDEIRTTGPRAAAGDFCFPVKIALGHALKLAAMPGLAHRLIPQMIACQPNDFTTNPLFCPHVMSHAAVATATYESRGLDPAALHLLSPIFDLRWDEAHLRRSFEKTLGEPLGASPKDIKDALAAALAAQERFAEACRAAGAAALAELAAAGKKAIVIFGRPYNCGDPGANLDLPRKISDYGIPVVPLDFLPFDPRELGAEYRNIYWHYGQRIVAGLKQVAATERLFPVYLTNFNCGPDSFLLSYAERIVGDKPLLLLELDEHAGDTGYVTRIEAFLDVVANARPRRPAPPVRRPRTPDEEFKRRTLWIPPMQPWVNRFGAAAMRRYRFHAQPLPVEDREAYEIGRRVTRGSECLPTGVTIGGLLKKFREIGADPKEHAFFMATAEGPCRYGQYVLLQRMILDEQGYEDVPIMTASSIDSYQGMEEPVRRELWRAFLTADLLVKMLCKVRPYERDRGAADDLGEQWSKRIETALESGRGLAETIRATARAFAALPVRREKRPLVGIVGEIYVRCNPFTNGRVIEHIESYGGEAWLTPVSEWFLYTAYHQSWSAKENLASFFARGQSLLKNRFLIGSEQKFYDLCSPLLDDRREPPVERVVAHGANYLPINFEGEAILTVGRAIEFARAGAALVVNCAPFGCMPGTISGAILQDIRKKTAMPIVTMMYDGVGDINRHLEVYLRERSGSA